MATFETVDVLSTTTGVLLGNIGGVYKVISYLVGRDVFTHELVTYGKPAAAAITAALPEVPGRDAAEGVDETNFREFLSRWVANLGPTIDLPDSLRDCLADDRNALSTLIDLVPAKKIIVVS